MQPRFRHSPTANKSQLYSNIDFEEIKEKNPSNKNIFIFFRYFFFETKHILLMFLTVLFYYYYCISTASPIDKYVLYSRILKQTPSNISLHENLKFITLKRHVAGTPEGKELAFWLVKQFKKLGLQTEVVKYYPYLNYPDKVRLAIVDPPEKFWEASLKEPLIKQGTTTKKLLEIEEPFFGYSFSGNITSEVIYANYGRLEDFQKLEKLGIRVKGKIVLVKYGRIFRGIKVMAAEKFGALGVIVYSDPAEDGFKKGKVYPEGPLRPEFGVQRGSSRFLSLGSGDALTPGIAATKTALRINISDAQTLPKIPSIPLSYGNAKVLLSNLVSFGLKADDVGFDWKGGLDIEYWTGPSEIKVNLVNLMKTGLYPIYNVLATIKGSTERDREVIFGNHRDAWIFGAVDPGSGTAVLLETARTLSELIKAGWTPRRTIKLCSWDAEEYGAIGSTEWVEDNLDYLNKKAVAYINVDNFEGDTFVADGPPSLLHFVRQATKQIEDPTKKNLTIYDAWASRFEHYGGEPLMRGLGAGSDYTPFYHHVGIPSLSIKYRQNSGIYHSAYDTLSYMEKFGDIGFTRHVAMTELISRILFQLSDSLILPFNVTNYATDFLAYSEVEEKKFPKKAVLHGLSFSNLKKEVAEFEVQARLFMSKIAFLQKDPGFEKNLKLVRKLNDKLAFFEKEFLNNKGISGREWFKHSLFAPGLWSGYGTQVFPALWEALDLEAWGNASRIIQEYSFAFSNASSKISFF